MSLPGAILTIGLPNGGKVVMACADDGQVHFFSTEAKAMCGSGVAPAPDPTRPDPTRPLDELQRWVAERTCHGCGKVTVGGATEGSG